MSSNSVVTFVSSESTSNKVITLHRGILSQLELIKLDLILADIGFTIQDILPKYVHLNVLLFLDPPQFTP